jgi:5-methylcytosine-specific restriction endonuclease McrA
VLPKPPSRIKDKAVRSRFAATRPWCQICGVTDGLHIHHMGDTCDHRRSDVWSNLMRLCFRCHDLFHAEAKWSRSELRSLRSSDVEHFYDEYYEMETAYDSEMT